MAAQEWNLDQEDVYNLLPDTISLYRALVSEAQLFPELAKAFFKNGPQRIANRLVAFFECSQC
jgi:hypothetical protein